MLESPVYQAPEPPRRCKVRGKTQALIGAIDHIYGMYNSVRARLYQVLFHVRKCSDEEVRDKTRMVETQLNSEAHELMKDEIDVLTKELVDAKSNLALLKANLDKVEAENRDLRCFHAEWLEAYNYVVAENEQLKSYISKMQAYNDDMAMAEPTLAPPPFFGTVG